MGLPQFRDSSVGKAWRLLNTKDQKKLYFITIIQTLMGFLDLIGVVSIGGLAALSVQGVESQSPGNRVSVLLRLLHIANISFRAQVLTLGIFSAFVLILKTLISIFFTRKIFFYLSYKAAEISTKLLSQVLSQDLIKVQTRTTQEILYIISEGIRNVTIGILATTMTIISDVSMLAIMAVGLFFIDPTIAFASILIFFIVGLFLHQFLQVRAREIGLQTNRLTVESNEKVIEVLESYRESIVRNRRFYYAEEFRRVRHNLGNVMAELNFQPYISKYVIEATSVLGAIGLGAYEFGTKNAVHAVSILAVFMAASSRIAPGTLRIQQGFLMLKNSAGAAGSTFALIDEIGDSEVKQENANDPLFSYPDFVPNVKLEGVAFTYGASKNFMLKDINLEFKPGSSIAIVGPSGAGKSTLVDLILGILQPQEGLVHIGDVTTYEAITLWPGAISYVPQNILITKGSIRENIGLGYDRRIVTDERVWKAIDSAQIKKDVLEIFHGIDYEVGENGSKLSGGQRQRIGIARALFTNPKLLILDEATSALDAKTELEISTAIKKLSGKSTVIIVAHRLSTVKNVDKVIYMQSGKVLAVGTFEEVRFAVPEFEVQASLMGL